jgi:hypothetical protein
MAATGANAKGFSGRQPGERAAQGPRPIAWNVSRPWTGRKERLERLLHQAV